VKHGAPNIGLRVQFDAPAERGAVVYSCDTSPCPSLIALARGADILIHEATFLHSHAARAASDGHTTGYQAGEVAAQAGVKRLILCHFEAPLHDQVEELRREACQAYSGPVEIPRSSGSTGRACEVGGRSESSLPGRRANRLWRCCARGDASWPGGLSPGAAAPYTM